MTQRAPNWSIQEDAVLRQMYAANATLAAIAKAMLSRFGRSRSVLAVSARAIHLKLRRPPGFRVQRASEARRAKVKDERAAAAAQAREAARAAAKAAEEARKAAVPAPRPPLPRGHLMPEAKIAALLRRELMRGAA